MANKRLACSQKETIWPTRRTYLHLQVLTRQQQGSRLQTHIQAILLWFPPWQDLVLFLEKKAAYLWKRQEVREPPEKGNNSQT